MIWILLGYLALTFFGAGDAPLAGAIEAMNGRVEALDVDDAPRERIDQIVEGVVEALEAARPAAEYRRDELLDLLRTHDAPRAQIDAAVEALAKVRRELQSGLLDMRFELRQQLTREQWAKLFPAPDPSR